MNLHELNLQACLESKGRSNGTTYTDAERNLAVVVSKVVLTATQHRDFEEDIADEDDVIKALQLAVDNEEDGQLSVPSLCRTVYRTVEKARLEDESTLLDFPKVKNDERVARDFTSINLFFRKAFVKACGFSKEEVESIFPSYGKKKKAV